MAYDEHSADRIRRILGAKHPLDERVMFGGIVFMVRGHMTVGLRNSLLMVRVGKELHDESLAQPHTSVMKHGEKEKEGFITVDADGYQTDADLKAWIERSLIYNATLKAK